MAENSKIEWCDHTFNPWIGCTKVSEGCANCYAEADFDKRRHYAKWGPSGTRVMTSQANWKKPLAWNRKAEKESVRYRVFCSSLADVFEDWQGCICNHNGKMICVGKDGELIKAQNDTHLLDLSSRGGCSLLSMDCLRKKLFELIDETPHLDWLLVTKRPENIRKMWPGTGAPIPGKKPLVRNIHTYRQNIWLFTSVENQEQADKRIPELLRCRDLSPVLGLSCEPLLGPIDLGPYFPPMEFEKWNNKGDGLPYPFRGPDWVIAGGESGPNARPMHPDWVRSLRDQCKLASVPFLFKQWGEFLPPSCFDDGTEVQKVGKNKAGRLLDGIEWNEFPD
jgi:protein gp37